MKFHHPQFVTGMLLLYYIVLDICFRLYRDIIKVIGTYLTWLTGASKGFYKKILYIFFNLDPPINDIKFDVFNSCLHLVL